MEEHTLPSRQDLSKPMHRRGNQITTRQADNNSLTSQDTLQRYRMGHTSKRRSSITPMHSILRRP